MTYTTAHKILSREAMFARINAWRVRGNTIVFSNGCFDLMHLGHVDYLEKASQLGEKLVIGLNDDASVTALKGAGRPILDETARARLLAALECVSGVVLFPESTPLSLIKLFRPDVLVKGADYEIEEIVGHEVVQAYGGKVARIPLVAGYSTSSIIQQLKSR